ncbi:MAG: ribonuclease [Alphaproteobacteria bacterium]|nr:ribonuclease [Alphaproteobacteria bacterium]
MVVRRLALAFLALACAATLALAGEPERRAFARHHGLADIDGFVETLDHLDRTGRLPPRYLTKDEARRLGWEPGRDLWAVAPGRAIGGDAFGNRERRLPRLDRGTYREADLDYRGGRRNARRLIWSGDGARFVTVDHYETFHLVPR